MALANVHHMYRILNTIDETSSITNSIIEDHFLSTLQSWQNIALVDSQDSIFFYHQDLLNETDSHNEIENGQLPGTTTNRTEILPSKRETD